MPCGSAGYWLLLLIVVPVVLGLMMWVRRLLLVATGENSGFVCCKGLWFEGRPALNRIAEERQRLGIPWAAHDIRWTDKTTIIYPMICSIAGLVAGLFGVGGGIVKAPLLLELGVQPTAAAATSATMIFFT